MARSQLIDLLDGYEEPIGADGETLPLGKRFFVRDISGTMTTDRKRRSSSRFYKFLNTAFRAITYTKAKVYGASMLTFGFLSFVFQLLGNYFGMISGIETSAIAVSAVFCVLGTFLLFFDKPIPIMLQDTQVLDFVFFEFFCIQRVHRKTGEVSIHLSVGIIFGVLLAAISFFVPPFYLAIGIVALLFVAVSFSSPEFSFITALLLLPYLNVFPYAQYIFMFIVLLTGVSFVRKVIWGKRVISFEQYDAAILLLMLMILLSGIFIKGFDSFASSAVLCVMSLGYYLTSNIITNRRLADRAMNAIVVSAIPVSIFNIISYIVKSAANGRFVSPSESAFFGSTSVNATFLIVAVCFSFAQIVQTHALNKKLAYIGVLVLTLVALLLTGEVFAVYALIFGGISYFVFKLRRTATLVILPFLFILPFAVYLLPDDLLVRIFDFIPSSEGYFAYIDTVVCSLTEFGHNFLFGIGIGSGSFTAQMSGYGIAATDSGNLLLELALEAGVFSLIVFIFLIVSRVRHRIRYDQYIRDSVVKHSQPIVSVTVFSLIFYGEFTYIWSDMSMFYLFFVVFAIESAMLRVSRKARDERILYYEDARSEESSAIDISLSDNA